MRRNATGRSTNEESSRGIRGQMSYSGARGGLLSHSRRKSFGFKRSGEEAEILPPLFLSRDDGRYSDEMKQILNGSFSTRSAFV